MNKGLIARLTKDTTKLVAEVNNYIDEVKMGGLHLGDLPMVAGLSVYLDVALDSIYERMKLPTPLGK